MSFSSSTSVRRLTAGDSTLDKHEVLLSVNANQLEVLNSHALCTHVTIHVETLANTRRVCALTNGTRTALVTRTVCHRTTGEVPTLDCALKALTFGSTNDVDSCDFRKVSNGNSVAAFVLLASRNAHLAEVTHRLNTLSLKVTGHWLVDMLLRNVTKSDLYGIIAVCLCSLYLRDSAGASKNNGNGNDVVVLIPYLGHTQLAAEDGIHHALS